MTPGLLEVALTMGAAIAMGGLVASFIMEEIRTRRERGEKPYGDYAWLLVVSIFLVIVGMWCLGVVS